MSRNKEESRRKAKCLTSPYLSFLTRKLNMKSVLNKFSAQKCYSENPKMCTGQNKNDSIICVLLDLFGSHQLMYGLI